jgi:predicted transcriptional regulator
LAENLFEALVPVAGERYSIREVRQTDLEEAIKYAVQRAEGLGIRNNFMLESFIASEVLDVARSGKRDPQEIARVVLQRLSA